MAILTRKLKNLPQATSLSDTDIIVGENEIETQKITLYQIVNFICSHNIIQNAFAAKSLFEEHVADMVMHITSSERTSWNDAYNKRHEHSNNVPYVAKGKDAAVAYGSYDFKFRNNLSNSVKILASTDGNYVYTSLVELQT